MRVFLKIAYDGTNYHGWQFQEGQSSIQGEIESALERISAERVSVTGASRTDAGVHALSNIAVFDTNSSIPPERYIFALNDALPDDVRVMESKQVSDDFNIRKAVTNKTYEYKIYNGIVHSPIDRLYSYHYRGELNVSDMDKAAKFLVGTHDFTSFSSVHAQVKSFTRTIFFCDVKKEGDYVVIRVNGDGFLYNMVRIIAGTLLEVGNQKRSPEDIKKIIDAKDRTKAGQTLPPCGLLLKEMNYEGA